MMPFTKHKKAKFFKFHLNSSGVGGRPPKIELSKKNKKIKTSNQSVKDKSLFWVIVHNNFNLLSHKIFLGELLTNSRKSNTYVKFISSLAHFTVNELTHWSHQ